MPLLLLVVASESLPGSTPTAAISIAAVLANFHFEIGVVVPSGIVLEEGSSVCSVLCLYLEYHDD